MAETPDLQHAKRLPARTNGVGWPVHLEASQTEPAGSGKPNALPKIGRPKSVATRNRTRRALSGVAWNVAALLIFIAIWQIASWMLRSAFFPGPLVAFDAFLHLATKGDLQGNLLHQHASASMLRVLLGFGVACLTAIPLGVLLGLWQPLYFRTRLVSEPLRFIPPLAWIPLAILFFAGTGRYVFLIWTGTFFPLLILTMNAVVHVDPTFVEVGKVYRCSRLFIISKIIIPAAFPAIFAGMRAVIGPAWMCIVAAEMLATELIGLGQLLYNYSNLFRMDIVIVAMVSIGLLGLALNEIFVWLDHIIFRYAKRRGV